MAMYVTISCKADDVIVRAPDIDDAMRAHFGQPPSSDRYLCGWYNAIGYAVKSGQTFKDLLETFENRKSNCKHAEDKEYYDDMVLILQWLDLHYNLDARSGF